MNIAEYEKQDKEIKSELMKFRRLNETAKLRYVKHLLLDYHEAISRALHVESTKYRTKYATKKAAARSIQNKKNAKKKALLNKSHAALAASFVAILEFVPWNNFFSAAELRAWTPFFGSTQFVAGMTAVLTWIISELDFLRRSLKK